MTIDDLAKEADEERIAASILRMSGRVKRVSSHVAWLDVPTIARCLPDASETPRPIEHVADYCEALVDTGAAERRVSNSVTEYRLARDR